MGHHLAGDMAFIQALACEEFPHDHGIGVHISGSAHLAILKQFSCVGQAQVNHESTMNLSVLAV